MYFLLRKLKVTNSKDSTFASSALLRLLFTSNSAVFVGGAAPRAQGTLATPLDYIVYLIRKKQD